MNRDGSKYANHPRIAWFGIGGTVAYVDYTTAAGSYFIGGDGGGGFKVVPPDASGGGEVTGFDTFDAAVEHALAAADA